MLKDTSNDVRIAAAEALCKMGREELAIPELISQLKAKEPKTALHAANVLEYLDHGVSKYVSKIEALKTTKDKYLSRALKQLLSKVKKSLESG